MPSRRLQPPPAALASPADETASSKAAADRLTSTLFLAVLLHGVVIMGVSFSPADLAEKSQRATSLEVVLIPEQDKQRPDPEDARLLARSSLLGAGNTTEDVARSALEGAMTTDTSRNAGTDDGRQRSQSVQANQLYRPDSTLRTEMDRPPDQDEAERSFNPGTSNTMDMLASPDVATRVPDVEPRQLFVSANTRESRIAAYLEGWKRKVERVGTVNYPAQLPPGSVPASPTLEVAVASNGTLREVVILVPSNNSRLDQAAIQILRLAAPFEPFPDFLRDEYDVLRFAYQWQFSDGAMTGRVTAPSP